MQNLHFKKATLFYFETIKNWLDASHVKEFWDNSPEHRQDILIFMQGRVELSPYFDGIFTYWIGFYDDKPYCLVMTSDMIDGPDLPAYYKACISETGKTSSIDFMIGNKDYLGKNLAGPTLIAFMDSMRKVDPTIDIFMIDPEADNTRAKHVYEKAGFTVISEFVSTQGSGTGSKHYLMLKKF